MPLVDFLFRCPVCQHDPLVGKGDTATCPSCSRAFRRGGEGGMIRVETPSGGIREEQGHELGALSPFDPRANGVSGDEFLLETKVRVQTSNRERGIRFRGEVIGFAETFDPETLGSLRLTRQALTLWPPEGEAPPLLQWSLLDIRAVQTSSRSLQISPRTGGVVQFRFPEDSVRRWENALHRCLRERYEAEGLGEILEFQPRIVTRWTGNRRSGTEGRPKNLGPGFPEEFYRASAWYGFFKGISRICAAFLTRLEVRGLSNVPREGPFILVANHQSLLDPVLVQVVCPRPLHTLTKSTKFLTPGFGWLLPRVNAIPTRRYRVDTQAVRMVLRRLSQGEGVGIYPEGERSWDGVLQPLRRGTVRLLLGAGVPVVPCGISGAYDVWPRWSWRIKRRRVVLSFGQVLEWPALRTRAAREEALPGAMEALTRALNDLGAWKG